MRSASSGSLQHQSAVVARRISAGLRVGGRSPAYRALSSGSVKAAHGRRETDVRIERAWTRAFTIEQSTPGLSTQYSMDMWTEPAWGSWSVTFRRVLKAGGATGHFGQSPPRRRKPLCPALFLKLTIGKGSTSLTINLHHVAVELPAMRLYAGPTPSAPCQRPSVAARSHNFESWNFANGVPFA